MLDEILNNADERMTKAVEHLKTELQSIRAGRATPQLLDRIQVDYYGTPSPINAVANITTPDPRMIVIQPWEKNMLGVIEKAIQKSDLGVNPTNDGTVVRLSFPPPTEDRRKELVKQVHARSEEARVAVRNVRRDAADQMKKLDKDKQVQQDEAHRAQEKLDKSTQGFVAQVDDVAKKKEAEVLEV